MEDLFFGSLWLTSSPVSGSLRGGALPHLSGFVSSCAVCPEA